MLILRDRVQGAGNCHGSLCIAAANARADKFDRKQDVYLIVDRRHRRQEAEITVSFAGIFASLDLITVMKAGLAPVTYIYTWILLAGMLLGYFLAVQLRSLPDIFSHKAPLNA